MKKFIILIPVYNDWKSVYKLIEKIDLEIANWDVNVSVFIVNDSSTEARTKIYTSISNIKKINILNMKRNQGHARCNAAGLKYLTENENFDYVILMDGDGEDRPEELSLLYVKCKENPSKMITANRVKRSEGFFFRSLYMCHKVLTYVFTGKLIKFGNYSCVPKELAAKLVNDASAWSSFSGTVTKVISDRTSISSIRGKRYFGPSQMNLYNLLIHSFSIIAVFRKSVIIRSIIFIIFYLFLVFKNLSIITFLPIIMILIFLFLIFKISYRENIDELNSSLKNIESIDVLDSSDSG